MADVFSKLAAVLESKVWLARNPQFDLTLLDFSSQALECARRSFARSNLTAEFLLDNVFTQNEPDFDLVFSIGVLEHYQPDQQAKLLRGIASPARIPCCILSHRMTNFVFSTR